MLGALFRIPALSWANWFGLAALIAIIASRKPGAAFWCAWLAGAGFFISCTSWLASTIERFSPYSLPTAIVMLVGYALLAGLQFGVFGYLAARLRPTVGMMIYPLAWVAGELLWPSIFPWRIGCTQFQWITLIQITELTGVYGISFLLLWCAALTYETVARLAKREAISPLKTHLIVFAGTIGAALSFGWWRTSDVASYLAQQPTVTVALVQPGERPWLKQCRRLSRAIEEQVDLICWPESAVPAAFSLTHADLKSPQPGASAAAIRRPYADPQCHLLFGASSRLPESDDSHHLYVSALLADPQEQIVGRYHKRSLVPFGEYIPGERWFPSLHRFSAFGVRYAPGPSDEPLVIPNVAKLGVLICYEDIVAAMARASVRRGADILVNVTNDFWFGQSSALRLHLQLAAFRAVENKRFLLRSTTTGATAVVSPTGRIIAQAPFAESVTLIAKVQPVELQTFYARFGNVFAWACCLVLLVVAFRRRRPKKS